MERAESRVTWPPAHAAEACRHHGEPGTGLEQRPQSAEPTPGSWRQVSVTARDRVSTVLSRGPEALSSGGPGADPVSVGPSSARRPHSGMATWMAHGTRVGSRAIPKPSAAARWPWPSGWPDGFAHRQSRLSPRPHVPGKRNSEGKKRPPSQRPHGIPVAGRTGQRPRLQAACRRPDRWAAGQADPGSGRSSGGGPPGRGALCDTPIGTRHTCH